MRRVKRDIATGPFYIVSWETGRRLATFESLPAAKKYCLSLGFEKVYSWGRWTMAPFAHVDNDYGLVYNPKDKPIKE